MVMHLDSRCGYAIRNGNIGLASESNGEVKFNRDRSEISLSGCVDDILERKIFSNWCFIEFDQMSYWWGEKIGACQKHIVFPETGKPITFNVAGFKGKCIPDKYSFMKKRGLTHLEITFVIFGELNLVNLIW